MKTYNLIKRIAKHGRQNIIVIPSMLQEELKAGSVVQLRIEVLKEEEENVH
jgi:hypothetical protein